MFTWLLKHFRRKPSPSTPVIAPEYLPDEQSQRDILALQVGQHVLITSCDGSLMGGEIQSITPTDVFMLEARSRQRIKLPKAKIVSIHFNLN